MAEIGTKALESTNSSGSADNSGGASSVAQEDTHMEGVETNETKALEGASNPGSANSSDNANSGGTPQDESEDTIKTYTPDEKKNEVLRILRWPEWAYYEILELPLDANDAHVKTAFRNKSKLTHTDRNDDVDAKKVFQSKCKISLDVTVAKAGVQESTRLIKSCPIPTSAKRMM
jgi:hypothetical protein